MEENQNNTNNTNPVGQQPYQPQQQVPTNMQQNINQNMNYQNNDEMYSQPKTINICGLLSFIFSLIAIFKFYIPLSITAIVLGSIGIAKFKPEKESHKWMAITGLIIGIIEVAVLIIAFMIGFMIGFYSAF